ncbi:MAG TPA: hypothetical protein VGO47_05375, partial [Chlamydiales bacterium]|nr:hypothetical protein [Chlamydiales bacterium]
PGLGVDVRRRMQTFVERATDKNNGHYVRPESPTSWLLLGVQPIITTTVTQWRQWVQDMM